MTGTSWTFAHLFREHSGLAIDHPYPATCGYSSMTKSLLLPKWIRNLWQRWCADSYLLDFWLWKVVGNIKVIERFFDIPLDLRSRMPSKRSGYSHVIWFLKIKAKTTRMKLTSPYWSKYSSSLPVINQRTSFIVVYLQGWWFATLSDQLLKPRPFFFFFRSPGFEVWTSKKKKKGGPQAFFVFFLRIAGEVRAPYSETASTLIRGH